MTANDLTSIFGTKNKYKIAEEKNSNNGFDNNQIVIGVHRRVSTNRQVLEGDSLEMQSELAERHAKSIGGVIFKYYTEEGLSAKKTELKKRPVMQEIIQDIQDGKINYIIAYRRDRLFRNQAENMWFWSLLAEHDCQIFLTASGETQVKVEELKKAGTTKMMESILSMMAEMESEITSTRVSDVMLNKAKNGEFCGGSTPIGYRREDDGRFVPIEGAKELITTIENLYLQGYGLSSIARWLNAYEVKGLPQLEKPIPKPLEKGNVNTLWNQRNIDKILFSPFFSGNMSYESRKNTDVDKIIVPLETIEPMRALERQRQLNNYKINKVSNVTPPRAYNTDFLLNGIVHCDDCGEKMMSYTSTRKDKRYSYYRCKSNSGNYKIKHVCKNGGYKKEVVESLVIKVTSDYVKKFLNEGLLEKLEVAIKNQNKASVSDYQKIESEIAQKQKEFKKITKIVTSIDDEELEDMYLKEQREILIKINDLKESLNKISETNSVATPTYDYLGLSDLLTTYGEVLEVSPNRIQKMIVEMMFSSIRINHKGEVTMLLNSKLTEIIAPNMGYISVGIGSPVGEFDYDVIGFDVGGDASYTKPITTKIPKFEITFNINRKLSKIARIFFTEFRPFMMTVDEKLDLRHAYKIIHENVGNIEAPNKNLPKDKKLYLVIYKYLISEYRIEEYYARDFLRKTPLSINVMSKIMDVGDTNFNDYLDYLRDVRGFDFIPANNEFVLEFLKTIQIKDVLERHVTLFRDKLYCACGQKMYRDTSNNTIAYRCLSKNKRDRESKGIEKCKYNYIKEEVVLKQIYCETGLRIKNKNDSKEFIKKIQVLDEFDNMEITYTDRVNLK